MNIQTVVFILAVQHIKIAKYCRIKEPFVIYRISILPYLKQDARIQNICDILFKNISCNTSYLKQAYCLFGMVI